MMTVAVVVSTLLFAALHEADCSPPAAASSAGDE